MVSMAKLMVGIPGWLVGAALLCTPLAAVQAQTQDDVRLAGVVGDELTGTPVAAARVTLVGTDIETLSRPNGAFVFADVPLGPATVRVEAPGYPTMVQQVFVREDAVVFVQFILPSVAAFLDEIFVLSERVDGGAGITETRTAADLLAGKMPGVSSNSGMVGLNLQSIQLRGVSSISVRHEPDIFLDGVRLAGSFGDALQLLAQIPANDVRDIRILRGPAAAFLQGSADGAIFVRTRSGPDD